MRAFMLVSVVLAAALAPTANAMAQDLRFFQLGTGPTAEARFPVGGLIANALSNPPGTRDCERGGSCGVPGMVAVAKSTAGSAANLEALARRRLDAALVHADFAHWAFTGTGLYKGKPAYTSLRGIAMLYPEPLHLVARKEARIAGIRDLRGKTVSFGDKDSATALHGQALLKAWGLRDKQVKVVTLKPVDAVDALAKGKLDAVLLADAAPMPLIADLARQTAITIVPISGPETAKLLAETPSLQIAQLPPGLYEGVPQAVPTLAVGVALVTDASQDKTLINGIARALWHASTAKMLAQSSALGGMVRPDAAALDRVGLPLHDGVVAFLAEAGLNR